jgi:pimeloyl-ACP methyl ester carboxylesterase
MHRLLDPAVYRTVVIHQRNCGNSTPSAADPSTDLSGNTTAALVADMERVREQAARDWCAWEDVHVSLDPAWQPNPRFEEPVFRLEFARLVTHYWANAAFLPDGQLERDVAKLAGIPAVLVTGRQDVSGPPDVAWRLHRAWPGSELVIQEKGGHGTGTGDALDEAFVRFASHMRDSVPPDGHRHFPRDHDHCLDVADRRARP